MPCAHPIRGYRATGGRVVFSGKEAVSLDMVKIGCGRCTYCRLERARNWACRCMCEAQLHEFNCFVTLTYSDSDPEFDGTLNVIHLQDFFKRLRARGFVFRYFACGEYGDKRERPHYHVLFFGVFFTDKFQLEEIWGHGVVDIREFGVGQASYVAQYSLKKMNGALSSVYFDEDTGLEHPPFMVCSRRPGIGRLWLDKFFKDVFPSDNMAFDGRLVRPPRYYMEVLKKVNPDMAKCVQDARVDSSIDEWERFRQEGVVEKCLQSRLEVFEKRHRRL